MSCSSFNPSISRNLQTTCHSERSGRSRSERPRSRRIPTVPAHAPARQGIFAAKPSLLMLTAPWCTSKSTCPRRNQVISKRRMLAVLLFIAIAMPFASSAQSAPDRPFVVEYYYKTKWGHADEFLKLFKKNHYPVLKKEAEMGRISKVWVDQPRYHTTEDGRWDYRVTIVFKNATVANEPFDEDAIKKQLFPDQETYAKEEQQRFEILDAHWDLPVKAVDLEAK